MKHTKTQPVILKTTAKGYRHAFTLIELAVMVVVIGALVGLILPMFAKSKHGSGHGRIKCINNLRQIGLAFKVFAGDNEDQFPYTSTNGFAFNNQTMTWLHFQAMSNELQTARVLTCPSDAQRFNSRADDFAMNGAATERSLSWLGNYSVSYFVGLDARDDRPDAILSGDRNVATNDLSVRDRQVYLRNNNQPGWTKEIHDQCGNILLGDGSVRQWKNAEFAQFVQTNSMKLNRLLLPN